MLNHLYDVPSKGTLNDSSFLSTLLERSQESVKRRMWPLKSNWIWIPVSPFDSYVTLGFFFFPLRLNFLICQKEENIYLYPKIVGGLNERSCLKYSNTIPDSINKATIILIVIISWRKDMKLKNNWGSTQSLKAPIIYQQHKMQKSWGGWGLGHHWRGRSYDFGRTNRDWRSGVLFFCCFLFVCFILLGKGREVRRGTIKGEVEALNLGHKKH